MSLIPNYAIVQPRQDIQNPNRNTTLLANKQYCIPVSWLGDSFTPNAVKLIEENVENIWKPYDISINLNHKKLLIQRISGFGDFVFLSPLIKYIKQQYPEAYIGVACMDDYFGIFDFIEGVDKLHAVPIDTDLLASYDYHFTVMGLMEGGQETDDNVYTLWFNALGVKDIDMEWKRPALKETEPYINTRISDDIKFVGIQPFAHSLIRDLHIKMVLDLIPELRTRNYMPLIFAIPGDKRINNFSNVNPNDARFSFEYIYNPKDIQSVIKLAKRCSWFITCDSMFAHVAPGLGVKTISIYGPFSAGSRVGYYKNSWAIDTGPNCRCRAHVDTPCVETGIYPSPCMNISPKMILNILDRVDHINI